MFFGNLLPKTTGGFPSARQGPEVIPGGERCGHGERGPARYITEVKRLPKEAETTQRIRTEESTNALPADRFSQCRRQRLGPVPDVFLCLRFHHDPNQRFGPGIPQHHPS